ncbi:STAS domain-containing protein [Streptomyces spectabilis]|uniref:Anti-sigma factor antagonist n=1 Tax=Streptomyces spectabilis TaxID=68270 RepID=A0A516RIP7_STRST|nr:STAS domain-containing protein [Streptomyces spectabilis]QDQ15536.1 STAS domain-containing protein [Streptomyces spectabilis]
MRQGITPSFEYLSVRHTGGWTVVALHGEIDIAAALTIGPRLDTITTLPRRRVVLDLNAVCFLDACGLELLCRARRRSAARAGRLVLVCVRPRILLLLRITGLDDDFTVLPSVADAIPGSGPTAAP